MDMKYIADLSVKIMVDETLSSSYTSELSSIKYDSFKVYHLSSSKKGFLSLEAQGKIIDFPLSWGVFSKVTESDVIELNTCDKLLNEVLSEFLEIVGSFRLIKASQKYYFVFTPRSAEIKKAA